MGGKRRELLGRKGHGAMSPFKVTVEEASTWIDVGFRRCSCVGPRGGIQERREPGVAKAAAQGREAYARGRELCVRGSCT